MSAIALSLTTHAAVQRPPPLLTALRLCRRTIFADYAHFLSLHLCRLSYCKHVKELCLLVGEESNPTRPKRFTHFRIYSHIERQGLYHRGYPLPLYYHPPRSLSSDPTANPVGRKKVSPWCAQAPVSSAPTALFGGEPASRSPEATASLL